MKQIQEVVGDIYQRFFVEKTISGIEAYDMLYPFSEEEELALLNNGIDENGLMVLCVFTAFISIQEKTIDHPLVKNDLSNRLWAAIVDNCHVITTQVRCKLKTKIIS